MKDLARIFKALADETRLQMLALILNERELCVCDCMQVLDISQSKASRHLRYLANAGILEDRREATWVYYRVAPNLDSARARILETVRASLPTQQTRVLAQRLALWREQKRVSGPGCAPADAQGASR